MKTKQEIQAKLRKIESHVVMSMDYAELQRSPSLSALRLGLESAIEVLKWVIED